MQVIKRDGKIVNFDRVKIENAVLKTCYSLEKKFEEKSLHEVGSKIENILLRQNNQQVEIETIQDLVEKELMHIDEDLAKAYILYRNKRNRIRRNSIYQQIDEMIQAKKNDLTNENGNMNSETPSGMISKVGFESAKEFALDSLLSLENRMAHERKDIHIHDLDFYLTKSLTCIQTDLFKPFADGFNTSNGGVRSPKRISTAAGLAAISIQTSQNEMHGGQSIHAFDFEMAPYVKMSFDNYYKDSYKFFFGDELENVDVAVEEYEMKNIAEFD